MVLLHDASGTIPSLFVCQLDETFLALFLDLVIAPDTRTWLLFLFLDLVLRLRFSTNDHERVAVQSVLARQDLEPSASNFTVLRDGGQCMHSRRESPSGLEQLAFSNTNLSSSLIRLGGTA